MRSSRFQFTIRQFLAIVGLTAVFCSLFTGFRWPLELAIAIVPIGFLVERMRGESGVMGAMMAGMLGFVAYGFTQFADDRVHSPSKFFGDGPIPYVLLFGSLGFTFGTIFGLGACEALALLGRLKRACASRVAPGRPADSEGPSGVERDATHPRPRPGGSRP